MNYIRLRFYNGKGLFSKLIKWRSWGEYSHVDIVMPNYTLIGAIGGKGGVVLHTSYPAKSYVTYDVPVPNAIEGLGWLVNQIGKPYDWTAIGAFITRTDWDDESKWFCSELATATLMKAGLPPILGGEPYMISPNDLLRLISWAGAKEVKDD